LKIGSISVKEFSSNHRGTVRHKMLVYTVHWQVACRFSVAVTRWSWSTSLLYIRPGQCLDGWQALDG